MSRAPGPDWPVAFFDDDYLKIYEPQFTAERTAAETDFIEAALEVRPGARILDLACGIGRHAIAMARRGHAITGVDFNPRYLEIAAREAERAGAKVRWMAGDMRELRFEQEFDAAYSYFTSFGYFSDQENEQVLERIARGLRPEGRFLLDMMNRDWLITHPQQRTWNPHPEGGLLMEEIQLDLRSSRVISRQVLVPAEGGAHVTKEFDLRAYTCAELTALMRHHGLAVREVWGAADRSAYSTESRRLILLAVRLPGPGPPGSSGRAADRTAAPGRDRC
jgi:SAM-dependent methyltransferase